MNTQLRFLDPQILSKISGMELRARTVVEGFLSGLHRSPFKGFSVEFAEYRQYTPGDDPRHIDWKVYARSDRYYVKEFEEETNLHCHILFDLSGSMAGTSRKAAPAKQLTKFEYATYLAASLAWFSARQRDRSQQCAEGGAGAHGRGRSGAPRSRSIPASSHSTEIGPS